MQIHHQDHVFLVLFNVKHARSHRLVKVVNLVIIYKIINLKLIVQEAHILMDLIILAIIVIQHVKHVLDHHHKNVINVFLDISYMGLIAKPLVLLTLLQIVQIIKVIYVILHVLHALVQQLNVLLALIPYF